MSGFLWQLCTSTCSELNFSLIDHKESFLIVHQTLQVGCKCRLCTVYISFDSLAEAVDSKVQRLQIGS